jgi:hypothetical protein
LPSFYFTKIYNYDKPRLNYVLTKEIIMNDTEKALVRKYRRRWGIVAVILFSSALLSLLAIAWFFMHQETSTAYFFSAVFVVLISAAGFYLKQHLDLKEK